MSALEITITKGATADAIEIKRLAGELVRFSFPKKGPIPHDSVHLVVEQSLGLKQAFWGMVAAGVDPGDIQEIAKAAGHASAKRAQVPDPSIVELIQAERLVECFEADLWGPPADCDSLRAMFASGCAASFVQPLLLTDADILSIRAQIEAFAMEWISAPEGARFDLHYKDGN